MTHVLLVDDELELLNGLSSVLRKEGYVVHTAQSAHAAEIALQVESIDVIVSDERMPIKLGSEFVKGVRESYPDIICIMLSGQADVDSVLRSFNDGGVLKFLLKPCSSKELLGAIRLGLEQRDCMISTRKVVDAHRKESEFIDKLLDENPNIDVVERDQHGRIIIDPE